MKKTIISLFLFFSFIILHACYWDYDTVEMERQDFPNVIELISGKFLRHSPEYFYWRIKDRTQKIKEQPTNLSYYDDLAVAYSKIGEDEKAIKVILKKDSIQPGLYETYANLGTFYIHNRQLKEGIKYIDKAIEINPDAHFGREIYQKYLAEYVLSKMKDGQVPLPLSKTFSERPRNSLPYNNNNFYSFLIKKHNRENLGEKSISELSKTDLDKAIKGIMGMMKFGNYDSPILLEVLGDLLLNNYGDDGAKQLAARAYFKASYKTNIKSIKEIYNKRIIYTLYFQYTNKKGNKFTPKELEKLLIEEIKEGNNFYNQIRKDEILWIKQGNNPEKEFSKKYYKEPLFSQRIQTGKGGSQEIENKYISDKSIENVDDYHPIPTSKISIDPQVKASIDSLFELNILSKIKEEKTTDNTIDQESKKENNNIGYYFLGAGLFLALILLFKKK